MPKHITETTQLKCNQGATPTPLSVTSQTFMKIEGKLQATEEDCKPNVNIKSFGACAATNSACVPATQKWENTSEFGIDNKKELLDTSTCKCSAGGTISIVKSAQSFSEEGGNSIYQPIEYDRNEKKNEDEKEDDQKNSWVINWIPKNASSLGILGLALNDSTDRGSNHWNIYAHGQMSKDQDGNYISSGFERLWKNGSKQYISSTGDFISAVSSVSKTFKPKLKAEEPITIKLMICNEHPKGEIGLVSLAKSITKRYDNITIEVSSGLVVVEYNIAWDKDAKLKGVYDRYATPVNGKKGCYYTVKNGEIISTDYSIGLAPATPEETKENEKFHSQIYDNPKDDYQYVEQEWKAKSKV